MKIGIIGAGMIGSTMARLFIDAGHEVAISNSRGPESLTNAITELGTNAHAATVNDAAAFGELILLAVPWRSPEALPHADLVANKVVIDAMNPYEDNGTILDLGESTSSEETTKRLPDARLVKAFNTIYYKDLAKQGDATKPEAERRAIFVAGNDAAAKALVSNLIRSLGFSPVDTGSLRDGGKKQQPGTALYNRPLTGEEAQKLME